MTDLEIVKTAFDILSIQYEIDYDKEGNTIMSWGNIIGRFCENQDKYDKDGNYIN